MDDMINRHDSIAEENIEPNGRPATNDFEEWSNCRGPAGPRNTFPCSGNCCRWECCRSR